MGIGNINTIRLRRKSTTGTIIEHSGGTYTSIIGINHPSSTLHTNIAIPKSAGPTNALHKRRIPHHIIRTSINITDTLIAIVISSIGTLIALGNTHIATPIHLGGTTLADGQTGTTVKVVGVGAGCSVGDATS